MMYTATIPPEPVPFRIVVTRYNEDISWVKPLKNVLIYNKGEPITINTSSISAMIKPQENLGREQYTIYKHIVDNYENLDEYTLFLQGNPFDHSPGLMNDLALIAHKLNTKEHFHFMYVSKDMHISNVISDQKVGNVDPKFKNYRPLYEAIFGVSLEGLTEKLVVFGAGSQFIVSKEAILRHPKDFYQNIVNILGYCTSPSEGHVLERLGHEIFITHGMSVATEHYRE